MFSQLCNLGYITAIAQARSFEIVENFIRFLHHRYKNTINWSNVHFVMKGFLPIKAWQTIFFCPLILNEMRCHQCPFPRCSGRTAMLSDTLADVCCCIVYWLSQSGGNTLNICSNCCITYSCCSSPRFSVYAQGAHGTG